MAGSDCRAPLMRPFKAVRAHDEHAAEVASPPYDVLSLEDAKNLAQNKNSFVRVSRAEVDFGMNIDPYSDRVYEKAASNFRDLLHRKVLLEDSHPSYYIWQMKMAGFAVIGVAGAVSLEGYDHGCVKKHELTRPQKQADRVKHIESVGAHTGPVMLTYRDSDKIEQIIKMVMREESVYENLCLWGVSHKLWRLSDTSLIDEMTDAFGDVSTLYIADGHHRSAAASELAKKRRELKHEDFSSQCFLGVAIPVSQVKILAYNRVVRDLNGYTIDQLLTKLSENFLVTKDRHGFVPEHVMTFGLYVGGSWYKLKLRDLPTSSVHPENNLDVSLLSKFILKPLLGISDSRIDDRIEFVGGVGGLAELMKRVDSGEMACAFSLFPTKIDDLLVVADSNRQMPPKSTWFEPKLVDGLLSMRLG